MKQFFFTSLFLVCMQQIGFAATLYTSPASGTATVQNVTQWDAIAWTTSAFAGTKDEYLIQPNFTLIIGSSPGNVDLKPKGDIIIYVQGRLGFEQGNGVIELTNGSEVSVDATGVIGFPLNSTCCHGNAADKITFAGPPIKKYAGPWYVTGPDQFTYSTEPTTSARWTGAVSSNWNTPGNWSPAVVPTAANNVLIPYPAEYVNAPQISTSTNQGKNLTVMSGAALTINGNGAITLNDSLHNFGTFTVKSGGALVQTASSGSCDYCPSGTFVVERDLTGQTSPWYMGSPINNLSKAGFSSCGSGQFDPGSTCAPPQVGNTSLCVMALDQNNSTTAINCSHSLWNMESGGSFVNGQGYNIYRSPGVLAFSGQSVNNGSVLFGPLGYSNLSSVNLPSPFIGQTTRGWHMVSNAYPSSIELTATDRTNMGFEAQVQLWDSDISNWVTPTPTGTVVIAVGQAFQVRVAGGPGNNATWSINNSHRKPYTGTTFYKTDESNGYIDMTLSNGAKNNTAHVYFVDGATDGFDAAYDANRLFGLANNPYIYTVESNGERLSYNALAPITQGVTKSVPLSTYIGQDGTHSITFAGIDAANVQVVLEDLTTGNMYPVSEGYVHNFSATTADNPDRFMLHFSAAVTTGITATSNQSVSLFPNPTAGKATVMFGVNHTYNQLSVTDLSGKVVVAEAIEATDNSKTFYIGNLAAGVYTVLLSGKNVAVQKLIKQ